MVISDASRSLIQISDDPALSATRLAILERAGFRVRVHPSRSALNKSLPLERVVLICQSVDCPRAIELALMIRKRLPQAVLVRFAFPDEEGDPIYEKFLYCPVQPETLGRSIGEAVSLAEYRFRSVLSLQALAPLRLLGP